VVPYYQKKIFLNGEKNKVIKSFVIKLYQSTRRNYLSRFSGYKLNCMLKAKDYEYDYWDGDCRFGYDGYKFLPVSWKPVAVTKFLTLSVKYHGLVYRISSQSNTAPRTQSFLIRD